MLESKLSLDGLNISKYLLENKMDATIVIDGKALPTLLIKVFLPSRMCAVSHGAKKNIFKLDATIQLIVTL